MGKSAKKRKKKDSNDSTDVSNQSTGLLSSILNAANGVLYSSPSKSTNVDSPPSTSTPKAQKHSVDEDVAVIHKKLDFILEKLGKLENIHDKFNNLTSKVAGIEARVIAIEKKTVEFENTVTFVSSKLDDIEKRGSGSKQTAQTVEKQESVIRELLQKVDKAEEDRAMLQDTVVDLQCRSMKNNLVFTGLGGETRNEDTESLLRDFIFHELEIDYRIDFGDVHRFGRRSYGKNRPIVARFLYHQDLQLVKSNYFRLAGTGFGIFEQYPTVIEDRRRILYPVMKQQKQLGKEVRLVRDWLYVNGQLYTDHDSEEFHGTRQPMQPQYGHSDAGQNGESQRSSTHRGGRNIRSASRRLSRSNERDHRGPDSDSRAPERDHRGPERDHRGFELDSRAPESNHRGPERDSRAPGREPRAPHFQPESSQPRYGFSDAVNNGDNPQRPYHRNTR